MISITTKHYLEYTINMRKKIKSVPFMVEKREEQERFSDLKGFYWGGASDNVLELGCRKKHTKFRMHKISQE